MKRFLYFALALLMINCSDKPEELQLKNGTYRAVLAVQDGEELPFTFEVESPTSLKIFNAEEVIEVDEVSYVGLTYIS